MTFRVKEHHELHPKQKTLFLSVRQLCRYLHPPPGVETAVIGTLSQSELQVWISLHISVPKIYSYHGTINNGERGEIRQVSLSINLLKVNCDIIM